MDKCLLADILKLDNLYSAWGEVRANKGAPGGDLISLVRFERHLELNLLQLAERVRARDYQVGKVRMVSVYTGRKQRQIAVWCVADRVLQRAVLNILEPIYERIFLPCSFGYRTGRSVADAVRQVIKLRDLGLTWVVDADIRDCFGTLDHEIIMSLLGKRIPDQDLLDLITMWLPYGRARPVRRAPEPRGISLGAVVSPLLCNIYLHQLDAALAKQRLRSVRYADDFVVLCAKASERESALKAVTQVLDSLLLEINKEKTRLRSFEEGFTFLGVTFKDRRYAYERHGKQIEAGDDGHGFSIQVDGYW